MAGAPMAPVAEMRAAMRRNQRMELRRAGFGMCDEDLARVEALQRLYEAVRPQWEAQASTSCEALLEAAVWASSTDHALQSLSEWVLSMAWLLWHMALLVCMP